MDGAAVRRLRGVAFLASGVAAVGLIVYAVTAVDPIDGVRPLPLLALLVLTAAIAFWQASNLLR
jgi:hypothetical protein